MFLEFCDLKFVGFCVIVWELFYNTFNQNEQTIFFFKINFP